MRAANTYRGERRNAMRAQGRLRRWRDMPMRTWLSGTKRDERGRRNVVWDWRVFVRALLPSTKRRAA